MRLLSAVFLALAGCSVALGQTYTISTFAGGGLPVNVPGPSAYLGTPQVLATDPAGNVFFIDQNTVLRLDATTGILTRVAGNGTSGFSGDNGPATSAQLNLGFPPAGIPGGLAVDSSGNLYIADGGNSRVRKVSSGVITTVAGNGTRGYTGDGGPASSAEVAYPQGLAVDSSGNLYISDTAYCVVRKVSNGTITTVAGTGTHGFSGDNGPAASAQLNTPYAVAVDSAGNVYIADGDNYRIRKVAGGVITTVAGDGTAGSSGDNGPATNAELGIVTGVAVDSAGNLYIADNSNNRIRKVSNSVITTAVGTGTRGFSGDGGSASSAQMGPPWGLAVDSAGNLYLADDANGRIRKVSNGVIATVAGTGTQGAAGDGGPATSAQLNGPQGVAVDSAGSVFIVDGNDQRIRKVANSVITTVAGNGTAGFSGDSGPAASAQLDYPEGIAVDSTGNFYIADSSNQRVRKVSNSVITTVAGNGTQGFSGDGGPAASAQLNYPASVAVDSAGNLYIADNGNNRVRKVANGVITTVAGNGTAGFSGDGGPAASAQLNGPYGIAVDSAGNLYIADGNNGRIREVSNGVITTVAGIGTVGVSFGDSGPATSAGINSGQLTVDSSGNLYITDGAVSSIRKISNGVIATIAGTGTFGFSGDSGPAASAQLDSPAGLALDSAGNLYVADYGNNRIRLLTPSGPSCSASVTPATASVAGAGGNLSVAIQTTASCAWAVQSLPAWITYSGNAVGAGPATITLAVSPNPGPTRSGTVSIAGITVAVTQPGIPPAISAGGIVNAASYAAGSPLTPGSIATAYGNFPLLAPISAAGSPLPTSLAGISLQFGNGMLAPLFFADVGQVNFQAPWELAGQTQTSLAVVLNGQAAMPQTVSLAPFSPGIFSTNGEGTGQGAILNSSYQLVDSASPAIAGSTIVQIYCTGLGAVTVPPETGSPAPNNLLVSSRNDVMVTIGGVSAIVVFSGLAPGSVGGYQVNALVPAGSAKGAAVPVVISIGGTTSNTVSIAVQ